MNGKLFSINLRKVKNKKLYFDIKLLINEIYY